MSENQNGTASREKAGLLQKETCADHTAQPWHSRVFIPERWKGVFTEQPVHGRMQQVHLRFPQTANSPVSLGDWSSKLGYVRTTECNPAMGRSRLGIHAAAWMDVKGLCGVKKPASKVFITGAFLYVIVLKWQKLQGWRTDSWHEV